MIHQQAKFYVYQGIRVKSADDGVRRSVVKIQNIPDAEGRGCRIDLLITQHDGRIPLRASTIAELVLTKVGGRPAQFYN